MGSEDIRKKFGEGEGLTPGSPIVEKGEAPTLGNALRKLRARKRLLDAALRGKPLPKPTDR